MYVEMSPKDAEMKEHQLWTQESGIASEGDNSNTCSTSTQQQQHQLGWEIRRSSSCNRKITECLAAFNNCILN